MVVFYGFKRFLYLVVLGLGFLQAKDVCIHFLEVLKKILFNDSPNSVNIPGDQFHQYPILMQSKYKKLVFIFIFIQVP